MKTILIISQRRLVHVTLRRIPASFHQLQVSSPSCAAIVSINNLSGSWYDKPLGGTNYPECTERESAVHAELPDYGGSSLTFGEYWLLIYRFHPLLQLGQSSASGLQSLRGASAEAEINRFHRVSRVNLPIESAARCCFTFPGRSLLSCSVCWPPKNVYTSYHLNIPSVFLGRSGTRCSGLF